MDNLEFEFTGHMRYLIPKEMPRHLEFQRLPRIWMDLAAGGKE